MQLAIQNLFVNAFNVQFFKIKLQGAEAVTRRCSLKKVFLKFLQNSQENNCVGVSLFLQTLTLTTALGFSWEFCFLFKNTLRYTNADLKISLYVVIDIKILP